MVDSIFIKQLKVLATIGIHPWEQAIRQPLLLDLQLGGDLHRAALQEDLEQSVDYDRVAATVTHYVQSQQFWLIEGVAEAVASQLLQQFSLAWIRVTVVKPSALATAQQVGITLERRSNQPVTP